MIESASPTSGFDAGPGGIDVKTLTRTLGEQAAAFHWGEAPAEVQERTLLVLFDTLGVMAAGARTPEVRALAAQFRDEGRAPVAGAGHRTGADASCWINGFAVCCLELDEGSKFARGHPAAHVLPAALAVGEGHAGTEWLAAFLAGYEVAARFGRATRLHPGVHPHGTWGATGSATVAARLGGLDGSGIAAAVDIAAGLALAPHFESAFTGHPVRNLWVGAANVAGLVASRLAAAGAAMVGGTAGFTLGGILGDLDPDPLGVPLGERFEILGGYFKRHAACAYTHPVADAALILRERHQPEPREIESVLVETYAIAATLDRTEWPTRLAAMFSIPYVVAVTLIDGRFGPEAGSEERRGDPVVGSLARRVEVVATDQFESRLPEKRGARVTLRLVDGSQPTVEVEQPVGDATHHPFGWDEVREKLTGLVGADRTRRLEETVRGLPTGSVAGLMEEVTRR